MSKINANTWQQIGYLEGLRVHRNELRRNVRAARKYLEVAKQDYKEFGMFEDCGHSYERLYHEKEAIFNYAAKMKIKAENFYKSELERLCASNEVLKRFMNTRQERNQWSDIQIYDGNKCII
jgi:hypothetical protein